MKKEMLKEKLFVLIFINFDITQYLVTVSNSQETQLHYKTPDSLTVLLSSSVVPKTLFEVIEAL